MARRRKPPVQRYHDRVAGRYDDIYDDAYWQWHDTLTWDHLKPHLPRRTDLPVLDLGCGTAKWGFRLAASGYTVTCVDVSGAMLERARRKFADSGLEHRAEFLQADLMDLSELPREHFAFAVAFGEPIGSTERPLQAIKQIRRRLLSDGVLVATFDNRWAAIDYYLERGQPEETDRFLRTGRTHWLTRDVGEQFEIHTHSPEQVRKALEKSGFEVIDMIGKTVLPMRQHRELLEDPAQRRAWLRIEKQLWRSPSAMGRAPHVQVAAHAAPD